jgi:hypothetical protein
MRMRERSPRRTLIAQRRPPRNVGVPCSFGDLRRELGAPMTVEVGMWVWPAEDVPADEDAAIDWLFARWRELDAWIEERS